MGFHLYVTSFIDFVVFNTLSLLNEKPEEGQTWGDIAYMCYLKQLHEWMQWFKLEISRKLLALEFSEEKERNWREEEKTDVK